jgi:hypothetical protein
VKARRRKHRSGDPLLDRDESSQQQAGAHQQRDDHRAAPTLVVAAHQSQHEEEECAREAQQAAPIDRRRVGIARLGQLPVGDGNRRDPDRDVDQEDPFPAETVGEQAANQRADRHRDADRGAVDTHGHAALGPGRELLGDQGQRDGEHDRAADALQRSRQVEEGRIGRQRAEQRGDREDAKSDREDAAAAEAIGERAGGEHQGGKRERIGIDHPLQVGEAAAEILLYRGQRRVDNGDVEKKHERRHADGAEGPPLTFHLSLLLAVYNSVRRPCKVS